jgi:hypothetical protein
MVNIIGAGPTGMTIAWELARIGVHVNVYDKKSSAGGSWWEPPGTRRDFHSIRAVFKNAFRNTGSLFDEMGIKWSDVFGNKTSKSVFMNIIKDNLSSRDYLVLGSLFIHVMALPDKFKKQALSEVLRGRISEKAERMITTLVYSIDGVSWDVMTAYEFIMSIEHVTFSDKETQIASGLEMNERMQVACINTGLIHFHFNMELESVDYKKQTARFKDGTIIKNLIMLCVDHGSAIKLIGDNWGKDADFMLSSGTYDSLSLVMEFEGAPDVEDELVSAIQTPWRIFVEKLNNNEIGITLVDDTSKSPHTQKTFKETPFEELKEEVLRQLKFDRKPTYTRLCWGSKWDGTQWVPSQTAGVVTRLGPLPFFGKCPTIALCGMMSPRDHTPYASIEAAIEVGKTFCHTMFKTRPAIGQSIIRPYTILLLLIIIFIIYILQ